MCDFEIAAPCAGVFPTVGRLGKLALEIRERAGFEVVLIESRSGCAV
jgi:hypothetical protein